MSSPTRTIRNLWRVGIRDFVHQLYNIGDTKAGTLVGIDKYGNKYFQNDAEELPLRTRWVDYKDHYNDPSQISPEWHAWISYMNDKPPTTTIVPNSGFEKWGLKTAFPNPTMSRGAFKTYSTTIPKVQAWEAKAKLRTGS